MRRLLSDRFAFGFCLIVGIGLVSASVVLAQLLNLSACPLCIWQRILYLAIALFAVLGLVAGGSRGPRAVIALLITVAGAAGVYVAGYQTYLQRFAQDTQCSGAQAWWERVVDWAGERLPLLFEASGLCSEPGWKFLTLSIAEWSLVAFFVLTIVGLYVLLRRETK